MRSELVVFGILMAILFLGCVAAPAPIQTPDANANAVVPTPQDDLDQYIENLPDPGSGPGDILQQCGGGYEGEVCFEDALAACNRAVAAFWSTSDGQVLDFESAGLDVTSLAEGKELCKVRVYVNADSTSSFAGTSATCLLEKNAEGVYDVYDIGPDHCVGSYVDQIDRTAPDSK
ncbi:MAG: hypothetical protein IPJ89_04040 [Candidatus Iainarchaeum archaeon]|uniref:Uncharacterized protein n=1 Tax=Candidatus Iainarchaeum sp. TaxID=3101447 RepID=A0A7T9I1D6_9ARCH|nr:MAG: hypothetical protein IPJ89_04040 [Candidatus Diapherotrites archaeon]